MMKKFKLLPYTKEKVFGYNRDSGQILGWQIKKFNIDKIWSRYTGKNVIVSVIDTGCDLDHPDLQSNIIDGYNFIDNNNLAEDDNGHGTHVAGIIASNNNSLGMVGVAPDTKIMPLKALNHKGNGTSKHIAQAIIWSVDNKADIITMSLGSDHHSLEIYNAIKYAQKNNIVVFCAAGNFGNSHDIVYPAKYKETISIGSINEYGQSSAFNCSGEELDFLSPGENIFSTVHNNEYAIMSGTSMSNPFVVGCASLYIEYCKKQKLATPTNKQDFINFFKNDDPTDLIIKPQHKLL